MSEAALVGEHAVCIDCGRHTALRLPRRFPHICTACLFPPPDPDADSRDCDLPPDFDRPSMIDALQQRVIHIPVDRPFGRKATPDPKRRETGPR